MPLLTNWWHWLVNSTWCGNLDNFFEEFLHVYWKVLPADWDSFLFIWYSYIIFQLLLSSSMDKTVRLWNLSSKTCLKIFSHSDYGKYAFHSLDLILFVNIKKKSIPCYSTAEETMQVFIADGFLCRSLLVAAACILMIILYLLHSNLHPVQSCWW